MNRNALKLPDPLLVRYYRDGKIEDVQRVKEDKATRAIAVTLKGKVVERWQYLQDIGWVPEEN